MRAWRLLTVLGVCHAPPDAAPRALEGPPATATDWSGVAWVDARDADALHAEPLPAPGPNVWVLHVGDSFVDGSFQQNLRPRFREAHANYVSTGKTATYTTTWAYEPELDRWLARRPSLVVVTLGANEVEMPVPEQHANAIEVIARKIAAAHAACVWTAPPLWKSDTGIMQVIHDHCRPCIFFDTDAAMGKLSRDERKADGIHPNAIGGARWAKAFWGWLIDHREPRVGPWAVVPFERRGP